MSSGPRGGGSGSNEGFTIEVPRLETDIKQGNTQDVTVSLQRGDNFKRDVAMQIKSTAGVTVAPSSVVIKASDVPTLQFQVTASKDAALGDYGVFVTGTPSVGEPTSANFNVKVIAQ
jgi:uncharacterized membrane protein